MMTKEKKRLIIFAVVLAVLLIAYFAVVRPLVNQTEAGEEAEPLETVAGEVVTQGGRYLMFPQITRENMQSVSVTNAYGTFEFYRDARGTFQIKGYEGTMYDSNLFASLVTSAGYTIAKLKVVDNATDAQLSEYGLLEPQAEWTVTTTEGKSYTVYIGYDLLTGGGYYCMLEGRRSVYVLDPAIAQTMLVPVENLCSPVFVAGISQNDYYTINNIILLKNGEPFCSFTALDPALQKNLQAMVEYKMEYPAGYAPNDANVLETLSGMVSATGRSVAKLGVTAEDAEKYGVANPAYTFGFTYMNFPFLMFFSERQEDGTYYVQSTLFPHMITVVDEETVPFLAYELIDWIEPYPFQQWIVTLSKMKVVGSGADVEFTLTHGVGADGNATLSVTADTGKVIPNEEVNNFRQFYKTMLTVEIRDYVPMTEEEIAALAVEENCILTVTLTDLVGTETVYRFYPYSSTGRRAFMTVNGEGEFYVDTDVVKKIASDANKVLNDLDVDAYAKD